MMCEEGNILAYSLVYLEMWRPWAPVHVIRRTRDGADIFSVGVDGVDGMRSHIVGAMSSKPGMTSWGTFASTILPMIVCKRQDKRRYLNAGAKKKVPVRYGLMCKCNRYWLFLEPCSVSQTVSRPVRDLLMFALVPVLMLYPRTYRASIRAPSVYVPTPTLHKPCKPHKHRHI